MYTKEKVGALNLYLRVDKRTGEFKFFSYDEKTKESYDSEGQYVEYMDNFYTSDYNYVNIWLDAGTKIDGSKKRYAYQRWAMGDFHFPKYIIDYLRFGILPNINDMMLFRSPNIREISRKSYDLNKLKKIELILEKKYCEQKGLPFLESKKQMESEVENELKEFLSNVDMSSTVKEIDEIRSSEVT